MRIQTGALAAALLLLVACEQRPIASSQAGDGPAMPQSGGFAPASGTSSGFPAATVATSGTQFRPDAGESTSEAPRQARSIAGAATATGPRAQSATATSSRTAKQTSTSQATTQPGTRQSSVSGDGSTKGAGGNNSDEVDRSEMLTNTAPVTVDSGGRGAGLGPVCDCEPTMPRDLTPRGIVGGQVPNIDVQIRDGRTPGNIRGIEQLRR